MEETKKEFGKFIDPDSIIAQLEIENGSMVADFGCGPGFFSIPFAKAVGEEGKVYALDVLPQALESVKSKVRNFAVPNVVLMRANVEKENGSKLESGSIDWVILKDILFQNQKKEIIIAEAKRVLKTEGRIIVVEWKKKDYGVGPEDSLRIDQEVLKKMFTNQNFAIEKDIDAGDFHYAFVATKK